MTQLPTCLISWQRGPCPVVGGFADHGWQPRADGLFLGQRTCSLFLLPSALYLAKFAPFLFFYYSDRRIKFRPDIRGHVAGVPFLYPDIL